MDVLWAAGAFGAAAVGAIWLGVTALRARGAPPTSAIVLGPDTRPRGAVHVTGDVIIRPGARSRADKAEMDVPTQAVDQIIDALQSAGFDVADTGLTVDTDEGEEMLTTIAMDLAAMPTTAAKMRPDDRLIITGDLLVERGARIAFNAQVQGALTLQEQVVCAGNLQVAGNVAIAENCTLLGEVLGQRDIHVGRRTAARALIAQGDLHLAETPDALSRMEGRRIHVAQ